MTTEMVVGLMLLVGAGLLMKSFVTLQHTELGVEPSSNGPAGED